MDGVNILNVIPEVKYIVPLVLIGLLFIIFGIVLIIVFIGIKDEDMLIFIGLSLIIGSGILTVGLRYHEPERYEVYVEDSVNFNEFREHYKIVEESGKIYTVEVRE